MIHDERATPLPFQASLGNSESPCNAYDLIKLELAYWLQDRIDMAETPTSDDEILLEACRIIYASEGLSKHESTTQASWLRDLLMSSEEASLRARMGPIRGQAESCLRQLRVNGKDNVFEDCPLEKQLIEFVRARALLGLTATNEELQVEACNIVGRMEESSILPSEHIANFYLRLIYRDPVWLSIFRQRAGLLPTDDAAGASEKGPVRASIHNYTQLEPELAEFARHYRSTTGAYPSDDELRKHARYVVYKCQDNWQRTAANNVSWLRAFKQRHFETDTGDAQASPNFNNSPHDSARLFIAGVGTFGHQTSASPAVNSGVISTPIDTTAPAGRKKSPMVKQSHFFVNASCYRRLAWELDRFVTATMSANNPNQHVPTDEELKHQARWILYDE